MKIKLLIMSVICMASFVSCNCGEKKTDNSAALTDAAPQPKKEKTVVVARVKVKDGKEADFLKVALPLVEATNSEPGNLYYELYQSPGDPKSFIFYEEYADDAAFEVHGKSEHFLKFAEAIPELLAEELTVDKF